MRLLAAAALLIAIWSSARAPAVTTPLMHPQLVAQPATLPSFVRGYSPQDFTRLYQLPSAPPTGAPQQTIALVDAYRDPRIAHDLAVYSRVYDLPPCPVGSCLRVVGEHGGSHLPVTDAGWALEESLDVEIAHGLCPTCRILLVEAQSPTTVDLGTAVDTAVRLGATEVSNSYGGSLASAWYTDAAGQAHSADGFYDHPGVAVVAASGDSGYGAGYPAASPDVVSVGGTYLAPDGTETAWTGSGGGCTVIEPAPAWQRALPDWDQTHCWGHRGDNDLAADASINSPAAIYDSLPMRWHGQMASGWWRVGGTSLASPLVAAMVALAGGVPAGVEAPSILYGNAALFHDVTLGENAASCPHFIDCHAGPGFDLPTGLGVARGVAVFQEH